jgi:hypothetical protein
MALNLIGMKVSIVISDPWDFITEQGEGPINGKIIKVGANSWIQGQDAILIQIDTTLKFKGVYCDYFIATARHESESTAALKDSSVIVCNFARVPSDKANSNNPFDLSWWRGGIALVGTLQKA